MTKKLAFSLEVTNAEELGKLGEVEVKLKGIGTELNQVKKDIIEFNNATEEQQRELTESGKGIDALTAKYTSLKGEQLELREEGKRLNTLLRQQAKDFDRVKEGVPDDSLIGLRRRYEQLRREIDVLSTEARQLPENIQKIEEAERVKSSIDAIGASVKDFRSQVGSYREAILDVFNIIKGQGSGGGASITGIIDPIANILGGGIPGLGGGGGAASGIIGTLQEVVSFLGPGGVFVSGLIAGGAAVANYVSDVTTEFERLFDLTGDITNLTGTDLRETTAEIKALSDTFDADYNEILFAANALTKSYSDQNVEFADSLKLIEQGFIASAGANDNFLDQLQEYAVQAAETGITQEQLLEILIRSTQEGIFSDKGIDLIKEGGLRIREETTATREALTDAFGSDFTDRILTGVREGTLTSFEALQEVSNALDEFGVDVQERQQVIADLFAGPGEDGTQLIEIIQSIDGELDDLIDTTNAYTQRQLAQLEANRRLSEQQSILAAQFAGVGVSLEGLGTRIGAFFTEVLNETILGVRAIAELIEDGDFFGAFDPAKRSLAIAEIRRQDDEALRQIEEGERKTREAFELSAEAGEEGIDNLRAAQQRLQKEIQEARLTDQDTAELEARLLRVTELITKVTEDAVERVKEIGPAKGSVDQLSESVSNLSEQLNKLDPDSQAAERVAARLVTAQEELAAAQERLDSLLTFETDEDRVSREQDQLATIQAIRENFARAQIQDAEALSLELARIATESQIEILQKGQELLDESDEEFKQTVEKIKAETAKLEDINLKIRVEATENTITQAEAIATEIANRVADSEEELQNRLEIIQLDAQAKRIQNRLDNEELANEERIALERNLQETLDEFADASTRLRLDFDNQLIENREETAQRLLELNEEILGIDPTDEGAVDRIREIEDQKTEARIEGQIARLELEKELLEEQNESTLEIENELVEAKLELNQLKNDELIKQEEARVAREKQLNDDLRRNAEQTAGSIGEAFGEFIASNEQDIQDFSQRLNALLIEGVQNAITLLAPEIIGRAVALLGPIFGPPAGAAAVGVVRGLLSSAIAAQTGEEGMIVEYLEKGTGSRKSFTTRRAGDLANNTPGNPKLGAIVKGRTHKEGGEHFYTVDSLGRIGLKELERDEGVVKATSMKKWAGLVSAINEDTGGVALSSDSSRWKQLLLSLETFQDGGPLANSTIVSQAPQLVNPSTTILQPKAEFTEENINMISEGVGTSVQTALEEFLPTMVPELVDGLDKANRIKERFAEGDTDSQV